MIVWFWSIVIGLIFRLRYRMRVIGLKKVRDRGRKGILFLPNHPALVDPIIMETILARTFHVQALADADQMDKFFIRYLGRHFSVRLIPDATKIGVAAKAEIDAAVAQIIADLAAGTNILLYPSGRVYRQRFEDLGGASAVPTILKALPDLRVVLVRTTGLWGSAFSWASGHAPDLGGLLRKGLLGLLTSGLFFAPRRKLRFEFVEPDDLPRTATPSELRRYLEAFYNADAPPNTFVPYSIWAGFKPRVLPEPARLAVTGDLAAVSDEVRRAVTGYLREITGQESFKDSDSLGRDLGLDSLARADMLVQLEKEFGYVSADVEMLQTVGDVMLAAAGLAVPAAAAPLKPVAPGWFRDGNDPVIPPVPSVVEAFLDQVARDPNHVVLADQTAGTRTRRGIATAAAVLKKHIAPLEGERVGILLPASVGADVVYIATLLAGKTPVMVNWTVGTRNVLHGLDLAGVKHVLTSRLLVERLSQRGSDFSGIADRLVYLEDVRGRITLGQKLSAALTARFAPRSLAPKTIPGTIAILFTSGSESLPKAVPLTSGNVLTNLSDVLKRIELRRTDRLIGFLPPFHSFGLSTGMLVPLCMNLPVIHHTDPTQGPMLARLIEAYKVTVVLGTPTFLAGILRAAAPGQLASLRLAVTGAEKCPPAVYAAFAAACPNARVVEGYGITECSPIVSFSDYDHPQPGTIGKPLPSIEFVLVHPETNQRVGPGVPGVLLVRGPSIFPGYLGEAPSPFVEFEGKSWYRTGDLVTSDPAGCLTFAGRLKRFIKLGGEMISLPAIESVLFTVHARQVDPDKGPILAVEATATDPPEIVLFSTLPLSRADVNDALRAAGLSGLHSIRRVVNLETIPVLGTGKTDYRALKELLSQQATGNGQQATGNG